MWAPSLPLAVGHSKVAAIAIRYLRIVESEATMANVNAQCKSCGSWHLVRLSTETCLHFPGLSGLKRGPIFVFPKVTVCLDCGFVQSSLSTEELRLIRGRARREEVRLYPCGEKEIEV